jgi:hypothetical protein
MKPLKPVLIAKQKWNDYIENYPMGKQRFTLPKCR